MSRISTQVMSLKNKQIGRPTSPANRFKITSHFLHPKYLFLKMFDHLLSETHEFLLLFNQ